MQVTSVFTSSYCSYICISFLPSSILCPMSKPNFKWYQHNYSFVLPYNVTSENNLRFFYFFCSSYCPQVGISTQRICFQIILFKTTFDNSFLYGSVNQKDGYIFRYFCLILLWNFRNCFLKNCFIIIIFYNVFLIPKSREGYFQTRLICLLAHF